MAQLSKQNVKDLLWRRGELEFKLHKLQKEMLDIMRAAPAHSTLVFLCSRQTGKTWMLGTLALMQCIKHPNSVVKILTDTKLHMRSVLEPKMREILEDCPDDVKPIYNASQHMYKFENGSEIHLAGSDAQNFEKLRGAKCHLALIDEAGFVDNLEKIVKSVLIPTTTHTGGKVILVSTPPTDPDHEFIKFIEEAEINNCFYKKNIYDVPIISPAQRQNIIKQMGGEKSEQFRREYLCEIIRSETSTVLPEVDELLLDKIVQVWTKPPYYDSYVSMDLGFRDLTVILFGYYDFRYSKIVIESEIVLKGHEVQIEKLARLIMDKEAELWKHPYTFELQKPYRRVSDINHIVTSEISRKSNGYLTFSIPKKDDKLAAINQTRTLLSQEQIVIHPSCTTLIRHLKNCRWKDKNKDIFARSPDDGHYDAVDALIYLIRSITYTRNPYPLGYINTENMHIKDRNAFNQKNSQNTVVDVFNQIFSSKRRK